MTRLQCSRIFENFHLPRFISPLSDYMCPCHRWQERGILEHWRVLYIELLSLVPIFFSVNAVKTKDQSVLSLLVLSTTWALGTRIFFFSLSPKFHLIILFPYLDCYVCSLICSIFWWPKKVYLKSSGHKGLWSTSIWFTAIKFVFLLLLNLS